MDIYLDLSIICAAIIHAFSLLYVLLILPLDGKKSHYVLLVIFMVLPVFSLPFFVIDNILFYLSYYLIILFALLPRDHKFKAMLLYGIAYFILLSTSLILNKGIDHYHLVPLIHTPKATLSLLLIPLPYLAFLMISMIIKNKIKIYHFIYQINIKYKESIYAMKGYLDSGNTLVYEGVPVIFIKREVLEDINLDNPIRISYKTIDNIIKEEWCYQGVICISRFYKKTYKKVLFAIVNNQHSFNDCDCLLNAHLI